MSASPAPDNEPPGLSRRFFVHLAVFSLLLGVWTWKLLEPQPVPPEVGRELGRPLYDVLAKVGHAVVYAGLAVLALTFPARPWRRPLVGLLVLHAVGTELAQHLMGLGRTGKVTDVLIDWAGIAAGALALRQWRKRSTGN